MRGLIIGRFQPFHLGHLATIKAALEEVDEIVVLIGSAEQSHTLENPFTAGERFQMILNALDDAGITSCMVIPLRDINRYAVWVSHIESMIPPVDVVYSNNPLTVRLFSEKGYDVRKPPMVQREAYSGTEVRKRILSNESWHDLVPRAVVKIIESVDGADRLRELALDEGSES